MMAENTVVIFDFDKTILDCDCDIWVANELGDSDLFNNLLPTMPLNSLMDLTMKEIHAKSKTIEDIKEALKRVPIHPRIISAIRSAYSLGCELRIVSDANVLFIDTILKNHGIRDYFFEIITNPCFVDEEKRLRILPYHDFSISPHGCSLCPPNMCKGIIIERIQGSISKQGKKKKIIYLGDGSGDYCPTLKLNQRDCVMPRKNYPLSDLINRNQKLVKAEIRPWIDAQEFERVLLQVIGTVSEQETGEPQMISTDICNPQMISLALSQTVQVLRS